MAATTDQSEFEDFYFVDGRPTVFDLADSVKPLVGAEKALAGYGSGSEWQFRAVAESGPVHCSTRYYYESEGCTYHQNGSEPPDDHSCWDALECGVWRVLTELAKNFDYDGWDGGVGYDELSGGVFLYGERYFKNGAVWRNFQPDFLTVKLELREVLR